MDEGLSLSEFWQAWELFRDPVLTAIVAGTALGFLSVYVVLRRMVFFGATASQVAGLGVAFGFYLEAHHGGFMSPRYLAVVFTVASAGLVVWDPSRLGLSREAVLGLGFSLAAGGTIYLGSRIPNDVSDIKAIIFGSAVVVTPEDFHAVMVVAALVLLLHLWWFRGFVFASFNPDAARVQKIPVRLLDTLLFVSIGSMVGFVTQALGAMPTFAMSTLPAMAALLLWRGPLLVTFLIAAFFGAVGGGGGYLVGTLQAASVGASQTLVAVALVLLCAALRGGVLLVRSGAEK